jgi:hypothetical protein
MIQQVGRGDEQDRLVMLKAAVGDGGGEMRFAAAIRAFQDQPAVHPFRVDLRHVAGGA